jgi:hypothetical protein
MLSTKENPKRTFWSGLRRFFSLISASHPLVIAVSPNADRSAR